MKELNKLTIDLRKKWIAIKEYDRLHAALDDRIKELETALGKAKQLLKHGMELVTNAVMHEDGIDGSDAEWFLNEAGQALKGEK